MATKRRQTGCGCLILVVIGLALLVLSGRATESRTAARTTPTPAMSLDAHGFPVGYTARLLSPMGMPPAQERCVEDYLEQTQSYATIQAVLLTDSGQKTLAADVHAIVAAKCPT